MRTTLLLKRTEILSEITFPLLTWYKSQARALPWREEPTPYRVWISEIMLQQTRVEAVRPYFERFITALPDLQALAVCPEERLLKLWEGLGYYNRARNLQKTAQIVLAEYQGRLPADFEQLLQLPGIGRYTAGAIASIAYGQKAAAVDGNVLRVITRLITCPEDILKDRTKRAVEAALLTIMPEGAAAGAFNQALMELGATVCLPRGTALCPRCPLHRLCLASAEDCIADFPKKTPSKARRIEKRTVLLLSCQNRIAIQQRPDSGLLAGLWEFPNLTSQFSKQGLLSFLQEKGFAIASIEKLPPARHIFSHIEWHMQGWYVRLQNDWLKEGPFAQYGNNEDFLDSDSFRWITRKELIKQYSIPTAFHYFFSKIQQEL